MIDVPELGFGKIVLGVLPSSVKCWRDDHKLRPMLVTASDGEDAELVPLSTNCTTALHLVPNAWNHLDHNCRLMVDTRLQFKKAVALPQIGELTAHEVVKCRKILSWYPVRWRHLVR